MRICTRNDMFCSTLRYRKVDELFALKDDGHGLRFPGRNKTVTAHYNGRKILTASLKRLGQLGLSKAT